MQGFLSWNVNLPRVAGVQLRLHLSFALLVVAAVMAAARDGAAAWWWGAFLVLLTASVVLHELAHCMAARRHRGTPHEIMFWPLGGLVQVSVPRSPRGEVAVALAGPLANLLVALSCTGVLFTWRGELAEDTAWWPNLFEAPREAGAVSALGVVRLAAWLNFWLAGVNLVPAAPLDGGRAARGLLWGFVGFRRAGVYARGLVSASAAMLCLAPTLLRARGVSLDGLVELPLVMLGVLVFVTARGEGARRRQDEEEEESPDRDEWRHLSPTPLLTNEDLPFGPAVIGQVVEARRDEKLHRQRQEEEEDRRVDEILLRLHVAGATALSVEDQQLLERVSARYRGRKSK